MWNREEVLGKNPQRQQLLPTFQQFSVVPQSKSSELQVFLSIQRPISGSQIGKPLNVPGTFNSNTNISGKPTHLRFNTNNSGKLANLKFNTNNSGKLANLKFNTNSTGKLTNLRFNTNNSGKLTNLRFNTNRSGKVKVRFNSLRSTTNNRVRFNSLRCNTTNRARFNSLRSTTNNRLRFHSLRCKTIRHGKPGPSHHNSGTNKLSGPQNQPPNRRSLYRTGAARHPPINSSGIIQ